MTLGLSAKLIFNWGKGWESWNSWNGWEGWGFLSCEIRSQFHRDGLYFSFWKTGGLEAKLLQ